MSEYITLLGAEEITRAGNRMAAAAEDMKQAASLIEESNRLLTSELTELTTRFEVAIECALDHLRESIQEKDGG